MALPSKGDPRRPLHLAARAARVLAGLFLLFGLCTIPSAFFMPRAAGPATLIVAVMTAMVYFAPGAAYLIFSIYMARRRLWAVIACLALTSIELLIVFAGAVMSLFVLRRLPNTVMYITLGITAVVILALGQLIYYLIRSFDAIKYEPLEEPRGFDVIGVQPPTRPSPDNA